MSDVTEKLAPFKFVMETLGELFRAEDKSDACEIVATRMAVEDSLNAWVDAVHGSPQYCDIMQSAVSCFLDNQLAQAIRNEGNPVYARILNGVGPNFERLDLSAIRLRKLSNSDIETLKARGFDYDGARHHAPAAEWLVRGSAYGKAKFRAKHPRKNPVAAYWEEYGLALPFEGVCPEGAKMVADLLRKDTRLPRTLAQCVERRPTSTDWRVAFCMRSLGYSFPFAITQRLMRIYGGQQVKEAIDELFATPSSNHQKLTQQSRINLLPSIEEILMMPRENEGVKHLLERINMPVRQPL